ncbi:MAG: hypothetical protein CMM47_02410 [Rhodospirillaceae bacterium]|nr:hypothetical protein [Rhodospirillaceae bacterium]
MCTSIVEIVEADGKAKGVDGWFALSHAVVSYDHPNHALLEDSIIVDFVNRDRAPGMRTAAELSLETAKALLGALDRAIRASEAEEAERSTFRESNREAA